MRIAAGPWRPSAVLLTLAGLVVAGIGAYFIAFRPSLLPEDIRFMQLSSAEVAEIGPRLQAWHVHVFRVLGGFALATGLLTIALATTAFRARQAVAVAGAILGGVVSIGLMAVVNFAIDSDFKWLLLGCAALWGLSLVAFWVETVAAGPLAAHGINSNSLDRKRGKA